MYILLMSRRLRRLIDLQVRRIYCSICDNTAFVKRNDVATTSMINVVIIACGFEYLLKVIHIVQGQIKKQGKSNQSVSKCLYTRLARLAWLAVCKASVKSNIVAVVTINVHYRSRSDSV